MPSDYDYFQNKRTDKTYFSRPFATGFLLPDSAGDQRNMRIISGVIDTSPFEEFARIKDEIVIRRTEKERQEIKALIYQDERKIVKLTLQRFIVKNNKPTPQSFSFGPEEIKKLLKIIYLISSGEYSADDKIHVYDNAVDAIPISDLNTMAKVFANDPKLIESLIENSITERDVKAIAYRKNELRTFEELLKDETADEKKWQKFFEKNPWIFGYGLRYIFSTGLSDSRLEQTVVGSSISQHGKRPDAVLKSRALISSICLVEIKKHTADLLKANSYRPDVWQASDELSGGIAQIQKTVDETARSFRNYSLKDDEGNPTGETVYFYQPKSYLVIGSLKEFIAENGVNEQKFSSFELLRKNIINPEIITYDELYERAKFIVTNDEESIVNPSTNS
jgi:hypothetical protein